MPQYTSHYIYIDLDLWKSLSTFTKHTGVVFNTNGMEFVTTLKNGDWTLDRCHKCCSTDGTQIMLPNNTTPSIVNMRLGTFIVLLNITRQ
mmetsp:Transcript_25924/g.30682  ORF Transcript_25924/g.30682 Transcript_25924/m.30682 type:complete len:90 (+) Transcript_25924:60-329(+)